MTTQPDLFAPASDTIPMASDTIPMASDTIPMASETIPMASETLPPCLHPVIDVFDGRSTCLACGPLPATWIEDRQAERVATFIQPPAPQPFEELLERALRERRERAARMHSLELYQDGGAQ